LTGKKVMEYGDASGTALMDVKTRTWSKEIIEAIDSKLIDKLPLLQGSDIPIGKVRGEITELFGFKEDVLVSSGGGDNMMGAIGTGNTKAGIVTTSLGTSGTVYAYSDTPILDSVGEIAAFCDSTNAWLSLLCTMNVTIAIEYIRNLFNLTYDQITEMVEHTPVGSDGLILLPYFEGERTPSIPNGTGLYYGLNNRTFNMSHMTRAAIEGVTLGLNYGLNRMRKLGLCPKEIRLTGGGSKNKAWRQIVADVFNTEVVCLKIDEGAAYGAALQAMWTFKKSIGEGTSIQEITDRYVQVAENTRASPKDTNVTTYRMLQKIQDELSLSIRNTFKIHRKYLTQHVI
jgi:xylulokinase